MMALWLLDEQCMWSVAWSMEWSSLVVVHGTLLIAGVRFMLSCTLFTTYIIMFCTPHPLQTTRKHHDEQTVTARTSLSSEMLTLLSHPTRLILQSPNSPPPSLPGRWSCKSCDRDQLFDGLRTHTKPGARVRLAGRRATFFLPARGGRV